MCHGLSTLIGAVRPLLCSDGLELSDANYIRVDAIIWPSWHRRRSRMEVDGADEKCSCVLYSYQYTFRSSPVVPRDMGRLVARLLVHLA